MSENNTRATMLHKGAAIAVSYMYKRDCLVYANLQFMPQIKTHKFRHKGREPHTTLNYTCRAYT